MPERYRGLLYTHPAIPHVAVARGRKWFGLRRRWERWLPAFSPECQLPVEILDAQEAAQERKDLGIFMIEFEGTLSEQGRFGLKGWCTRKVTIHSISRIEQSGTSSPANRLARSLTGMTAEELDEQHEHQGPN